MRNILEIGIDYILYSLDNKLYLLSNGDIIKLT